MVRKKNTDETAAAVQQIQTRKTRKRRNIDEEEGDADNTIMEKSSKSSRSPKTPSTRHARKKNMTTNEDPAMLTRSRRVKVIKSSSDSDIENNAEESKSKINKVDLLGVDSYPTRSRSKKVVASVTLKDSINSGVEDWSDFEPKKLTRKKRVLTSADNTLTDIPSPIKGPVKSTRSQAKTSTIEINTVPDPQGSEILINIHDSPAEKKNTKSSTLRRIVETPRKVSPRRQSNSFIKLPSDTVTPESSPMLVNLTPHRSTKTPKKSPLNFGSPKTHSLSPLRQSKTPRKLTVNVESPATSDKSSVSSNKQSLIELDSVRRDPFVVLTDCQREQLSPKASGLESPENFVSTVKLRLRKSSPKVPTASSHLTVAEISPRKKSPNKKAGILASKIRKSPIKTPASSTTPAKRQSSLHTPVKTPRKSPGNFNLDSIKRLKSTTKQRSPITSLGTPLRAIPKMVETIETKSVNSPCKLAPKKIHMMLQLENLSPQTTPRGRIRRSLHLTPDFIKFSSGSTSSPIPTPKKTDLGDLKEPKMTNDESSELLDASNFMNVSKGSAPESSAAADGTYDLSKESKDVSAHEGSKNEDDIADKTEADDATYELAEPKTPNLRKQSKKRPLSSVEPDKCTPDAKKRCRVRFASPNREKCIIDSPAGQARKSLPTVTTPAKPRVGSKLTVASSRIESSRRRSRSLTKIDEKTPANRTVAKRRSISASDLTNKTPKLNQSTQNSVNRLSRPRQLVNSEVKLDVKPLIPRKAPNFAQIHQKKFAEMESLVDAKKRVAKRHEAHNTLPSYLPLPSTRATQSTSIAVPEPTTVQSSKKPAPLDTQNGQFNRYGFKLRKAEAMNVITKNPGTVTRSKNHQEANRSILKGVRTNRRFELQMKARNIKL